MLADASIFSDNKPGVLHTAPPPPPAQLHQIFVVNIWAETMAAAQRPGGQQAKICQFKLVLLGKKHFFSNQINSFQFFPGSSHPSRQQRNWNSFQLKLGSVQLCSQIKFYFRGISSWKVFVSSALCEGTISWISRGKRDHEGDEEPNPCVS